MRINKRNVEALSIPHQGYQLHWDDTLPGFGVRITDKGYKAFVFQRRVNGRDRRMTIGRYGDTSPDQARRMAIKLAGDIIKGVDPVEEKKRRKAETLTLREVFDDYLIARDLKPLTISDMHKALKNLSDWMDRPIMNISRDMVIHRHREMGKRSKARANVTMRYLRAMMNHAAARYRAADGKPILDDNPVQALSQMRAWYRIERRKTVIKPYQLSPWLREVLALKEDPSSNERATASDFLLLVLLTGLRRSEAESLCWDQIDLRDQTLTVIDTKNHQDHTLPLSDYLFDMLRQRQKEAVNEFVFPGRGGVGHIYEPRKAMVKVMEESGIQFCIHDLRRTFATIADSLDVPGYAVKALLNHKDASDVTAGYIVVDVERLRRPMQRITDYILASQKKIIASTVTDLFAVSNSAS